MARDQGWPPPECAAWRVHTILCSQTTVSVFSSCLFGGLVLQLSMFTLWASMRLVWWAGRFPLYLFIVSLLKWSRLSPKKKWWVFMAIVILMAPFCTGAHSSKGSTARFSTRVRYFKTKRKNRVKYKKTRVHWRCPCAWTTAKRNDAHYDNIGGLSTSFLLYRTVRHEAYVPRTEVTARRAAEAEVERKRPNP